MSAILAVCGDTFCAMVSDGRYVEEPITGEKPHILKNDLPKVRKINRNVVVGFAGDTLAAVLDELRRIEAGQGVNGELLDTIQMIATIMNGMQEDFAYDQ